MVNLIEIERKEIADVTAYAIMYHLAHIPIIIHTRLAPAPNGVRYLLVFEWQGGDDKANELRTYDRVHAFAQAYFWGYTDGLARDVSWRQQ